MGDGSSARSRKRAKVSVVTTAWNEEGNLVPFYSELREVLERDGLDFEILIVDNGSTDDSLRILRKLRQSDPRLAYVSLSRNFGHQGGLVAAMEHCTGDVVVTLDADLQHPPAFIPRMLDLWEQGNDVVSTYKQPSGSGSPVSQSSLRRAFDRLFYRGLSLLCSMPLDERQSDFRLLDRAALDAVIALPEKSKFLRGLTHWIGFRQAALPYEPARRHSGRTKFSLTTLMSFALSGVLSFSILPLRLFTIAGMCVAAGSIGYATWALIVTLTDPSNTIPHGWASLAVAVSFLGGVQLIGIGMIGEYVGRVLSEVHGRPTYIVREAAGGRR